MVNEGNNPMEWSLFQVSAATETLKFVCHSLAKNAGWWHDTKTGESATANPLCFSNKLMLIVSEVSEAMEGDRKGLMDDKLPNRPMREVELADALIRICDLAGAYNLDLGGAVAEKLAFNAKRPDHKVENRVQEGGKAY
jgi:NTP pyrophosphatase (non-canonical NTP hydrolase)